MRRPLYRPCQASRYLGPLVFLALALPAFAADDNLCDEAGDQPDLAVASIYQTQRWGSIGGITAYSLGVIACNLGTCWVNWDNATTEHPVIGQNVFRLKDGRFEQLGQSWLKHGFNANSFNFCSEECIATDGKHLGVNCSDTYSASLNGRQNLLGPKFEINAATGEHPHPVTDMELTGDAIYKRLQVKNVDLDPALNAGALYYGEIQYVTADETPASGGNLNVGYRQLTVTLQTGSFQIGLTGETLQGPALAAWAALDPAVELRQVDVPVDGRFFVGARATDLGNGTWRYEYAVHNIDSHRSAGSFRVPLHPQTLVSNVGFHDVDYHSTSGPPPDLTDWPGVRADGTLAWTTSSFAANAEANALRWGTLYNFRFDADAPPAASYVTLGLFRPGSPAEIVVPILGPRRCVVNASCDGGESSCTCASDCGAPPSEENSCGDGIDEDCDGAIDCADSSCCGSAACPEFDADDDGYLPCADCDDSSAGVWSIPSEARDLHLSSEPEGTLLTWSPPSQPGADAVTYDVLRSMAPSGFVGNTTCLEGSSETLLVDADPGPAPGILFAYLVRARNGCPGGAGSLGAGSNGVPRVGTSCP